MLRNRIRGFFPFPINLLIHRIKLKATNVCFPKIITKASRTASAIAAATAIVAVVATAPPAPLGKTSAEDSNFSSPTDKLEDRKLNFVRLTSNKLEKRRVELRPQRMPNYLLKGIEIAFFKRQAGRTHKTALPANQFSNLSSSSIKKD